MSNRSRLVRFAGVLTVASVMICAFATTALALDQTPVSRMIKGDSNGTGYIAGDGAILTWLEWVYGSESTSISIHAIDVHAAGSKEVTIAVDATCPVVSGRNIFYTDELGVHQTNFDSSETTLLASFTNAASKPFSLAVSGDILVWDHGGPSGPVEGMHLSTGERFMISNDQNSYQPDVAGDWVVYTKNFEKPDSYINGDIKAYQISTGRTYTLCNNARRQYAPRIGDNGIVVWQDERNEPQWRNMDVYGSSVWTRKEFPITTAPGNQGGPEIIGDVVAYTDDTKPGGYMVVGRDLVNGSTFGMFAPSLTSPSSSWSGIGGGGVAWTKTKFIDDGSFEGRTESNLYIAYPAQLGQLTGSDRYQLAVAASRSAYPAGAQHAVIASGQNWSDSLSGAGLVATDSAFLLTAKDVLPACTAAELRRLKVTSADILGGSGSVSSGVQIAIKAILAENASVLGVRTSASTSAGAVNRIQGRDRYAVAALIARRVAARPDFGGTVLIASGTGFTDAVSASPLASHAGLPVLLAGPRGLTAGEMAALRAMKAKKVVIVGGPASVPAAAVAQANSVVGKQNVTRVWGANRYSTSSAVAKYGVDKLGLKWQGAGIASGSVFSDSIVGGVLKGKKGSVLLLTDGRSLSPDTAYALRKRRVSLRSADYIGGTGTISRNVRAQVRAILR